MEPEKTSHQVEKVDKFESLKKITPLSKYLALVLFIILPFLGGYIGYTLTPERVIEVEREVTKEVEIGSDINSVESTEMKEVLPAGIPYISDVSVVVEKETHTVRFNFIPEADFKLIYPSDWEIVYFNNQITKGDIGETLFKISNPATPGKPGTDIPREGITANLFLGVPCGGNVSMKLGEINVYDTGWKESNFAGGLFYRSICIPINERFLHLTFAPLFEETRELMDSAIEDMFANSNQS